MIFNSIYFLLFFIIVYFLYWYLNTKNLKIQNILLLVASYFFYSCWDWRFSFLLLFSTLLDYYSGKKIKHTSNKRFWLFLSVGINILFLGVFKYFDFFSESFSLFLNNFNIKTEPIILNIILPVGISFYTFHGISYVIDCYNDKIEDEKSFVNYALFVSYFPLLVAGPIERATHLLPQINKKRVFNYAKSVDGLRQILWGFFKKIVIADQCAEFANMIFNEYNQYNGATLFLGGFLFTIQIYCDFSGYSDIALGVSRLLGIELLRNFNYPYFSRDIAEFWRRWHISLSSWFKDYVYYPLGGSKKGITKTIRNTLIIFLISGFWHGANWTFICWGGLNALYIIPLIILGKNRKNIDNVTFDNTSYSFKIVFQMLSTFILTIIAWIVFRSQTITDAFRYIKKMIIGIINKKTMIECFNFIYWKVDVSIFILIGILFSVEWYGRQNNFGLKTTFLNNKFLRYTFYYLLVVLIYIYYNKKNEQQFIYFQF